MIGEHLLDPQTQAKLLSLGIGQPELLPASVLFAAPLFWLIGCCMFHDWDEPFSPFGFLLPWDWDVGVQWFRLKLLVFLLACGTAVAGVYKLLLWLG